MVLHGYETWSKIDSGAQADEIYTYKLDYSLGCNKNNEMCRMTWAWNVTRMGRRRINMGYWLEIHEGTRSRCRWVDNIKVLLEKYNEVVWTGVFALMRSRGLP
jgi:hypothetical protein